MSFAGRVLAVLALALVPRFAHAAGEDASEGAKKEAGESDESAAKGGPVGAKAPSSDAPAESAEEPSSEGPKTLPRRYGVVVESSLGAAFFLSDFGKIVSPGPVLRLQTGVEIFRWLMPFVEGDLAMFETSPDDGSKKRAFPVFSFGGGVRLTLRPTERVGLFVAGSLGLEKAEVATNTLLVLGYRNAESFGLYAGGRAGVEWYQRDRHLAFALHAGARDVTGFKKATGGSLPLALDAVLALRYAF